MTDSAPAGQTPAFTAQEFADIITSVSMMTKAEALDAIDTPITEAGIDSLDLELLRATLRKRHNRDVPDAVWLRSRSLRELLDRL